MNVDHRAKLDGNNQASALRIVVDGCDARLPAELFALVRRELEATEAYFVTDERPGRRGRYHRRAKTVRYYQLDKRGRLRTNKQGQFRIPAGQLPRILAHLGRVGCDVQVMGQTFPRPLTSSLVAALDESPLTHYERRYLHAGLSNRLGQIITDSEAETADLMALHCDAMADFNVAIVCNTKADALVMQSRLARLTNRRVLFYTQIDWDESVKTMICNPPTAQNCLAERFPVILFADPDAVLSHHIDKDFCRQPHRRFVFVPEGRRFRHVEQLKVEAVCGPVIYPPADQRLTETTVRVCMTQVGLPEMGTEGLPAYERYQRVVSHHAAFNDAVANIAATIGEGRWVAVHELGLKMEDGASYTADKNLDTVVLVETLDHAQELARRLPGWKVLDASQLPLPGFGDPIAESFEFPRRAIMTMLRSTLTSIVCDCLIRADGGSTCWQHAWGPQSYLSSPEMLVVDITPGYDRQGVRNAGRRRREYQRRGWPTTAGYYGPRRPTTGEVHTPERNATPH